MKPARSTKGAKARVLKKYPNAVAKEWADVGWCIERYLPGKGRPLGRGNNPVAAWKDAARKL